MQIGDHAKQRAKQDILANLATAGCGSRTLQPQRQGMLDCLGPLGPEHGKHMNKMEGINGGNEHVREGRGSCSSKLV